MAQAADVGFALGPALVPSLTAYRILFAICGGAALLAAILALLVSSNRSSAR